MPRFLKTVSLWYWLHAFVLLVSWRLLGLMTLTDAPDSGSYVLSEDISSALSSARTLGYPIFLYLVSKLSPEFERLPDFQFILYSLSTFVFLIGLRHFGVSKVKSLVITLPIFYLEFAKIYIPYQLTESLAVTFAILTLGILLILVSQPQKPALWILLGLSIFCTYQVRPAFLFLIPLVPVLGLGLLLFKRIYDDYPYTKSSLFRFITYLVITAVIPLLAFSTLRLAVVGHFGLVSFGGFNLIGITSQMLNEEMVEQLPDQDKELATSIVKERDDHRAIIESQDPKFSNHPVITNNVPVECTNPLPMDYRSWITCYNYHIWILSVPLAADRSGHGNVIAVNQDLKSLSRHIIAANPRLYLSWLSKAFADSFFWLPRIDGLIRDSSKVLTATLLLNIILEAFNRLTTSFHSRNRLLLFSGIATAFATLIVLARQLDFLKLIFVGIFNFIFESSFLINLTYFLLAGLLVVVTSVRGQEFARLKPVATNLSQNLYLALITLSYFLAGILLVIAVEPPISRYLMAVYTFFPSLFLVESYSILSYRFAQLRVYLNAHFNQAKF